MAQLFCSVENAVWNGLYENTKFCGKRSIFTGNTWNFLGMPGVPGACFDQHFQHKHWVFPVKKCVSIVSCFHTAPKQLWWKTLIDLMTGGCRVEDGYGWRPYQPPHCHCNHSVETFKWPGDSLYRTHQVQNDCIRAQHSQLILHFITHFLSNFSCICKHGSIPHICHFLYTGKIFQAKVLHPKARKLRQIEFRDKIA